MRQSVNALLGLVAGRQHGVVTRVQLLRLGITDRQITRMLACGRLVAIHRGVYAVGHVALSAEGRLLAAALAGGADGRVSFRAAAAHWEVRPTLLERVDVTTPVAGRRSTPAIAFHYSRRLGPDQVTMHRGVPVTMIERTIADLATVLAEGDLRRTIERGEARWSLDIARVLRAAEHREGAAVLRGIALDLSPAMTRSELEDRLCALVLGADVQRPLVNVRVQGFEVDLAWPDHRVIVEADGHAFHLSRAAVERDRHRDAVLTTHGWRILRFTWQQVTRRPHEVLAAITAVLTMSAERE